MVLPPTDDCIVAIATGPAAAPLGIIRLSGPTSHSMIRTRLFDPPDLPTSTRLTSARLRVFRTRAVPVELIEFVAPRSYTGQDLVELHLPGAPPLLQAVVDDLVAAGARVAWPGEFTSRAFRAGKLDASAIEGVLALLRAASDADTRAAARLSSGDYGRSLHACRETVLDLLARVEAGIDFVEEEDVRFIEPHELRMEIARIEELLRDLGLLGEAARQRTLPHVVLAGRPNAGKSTLFNALVGTSRAIVSDQAGTTRDVLGACIDIGGASLVLQDTAGIAPAPAGPDRQAQEVGADALRDADLVLWVHAGDQPWGADDSAAFGATPAARRMLVRTKIDLAQASQSTADAHDLRVCALSGAGIAELRHAIRARLEEANESPSAAPRAGLTEKLASLVRACAAQSLAPELVAWELREFATALDRCLDDYSLTDNVLSRIFSRFCIGK